MRSCKLFLGYMGIVKVLNFHKCEGRPLTQFSHKKLMSLQNRKINTLSKEIFTFFKHYLIVNDLVLEERCCPKQCI